MNHVLDVGPQEFIKNSFVVGDKYIVHYENSFDIIRGGVVVDVKE